MRCAVVPSPTTTAPIDDRMVMSSVTVFWLQVSMIACSLLVRFM